MLAGVEVTVTSLATGWRQTVTTEADGGFIVPSLSPGTYRVRLQREGFVPAEIPTLVLNVNDQRAIRVRLTVAGVGETVSVQAEPARISAGASVGTVIDHQFVENMPLNGRSFQTLIALTPGVVAVRTSFAELGQFSVNGQRSNSNYFMVDGVSANVGLPLGGNLGQSGSGSMPGLTSAGSTQSLVSVDALEEFRIETSSYAAEFGRVPGGQISLVTRSGTNALHGSAFEYVRNEAVDANDSGSVAGRLSRRTTTASKPMTASQSSRGTSSVRSPIAVRSSPRSNSVQGPLAASAKAGSQMRSRGEHGRGCVLGIRQSSADVSEQPTNSTFNMDVPSSAANSAMKLANVESPNSHIKPRLAW